jgi:VWFA-related protein
VSRPLRIPLLLAAFVAAAPLVTAAQVPESSVRLTSPLGRTGVPGIVRVVAQVVTPMPGGRVPVRFFVDGKPLGVDEDGPPYMTEWEDDNPYEPRVIRVEVDDADGRVLEDTVSLKPLEVIEEASVASVLVEATVTDADGRHVRSLGRDQFSLLENGIPQALDVVQVQELPTTFTLLVDGSQSMSRRIDLVRATARRLATGLRNGDMVVVAPFRRGLEAVTGPTNDEQTIADAISGIRANGGTAILDSLAELPDAFARVEGRQVVILVTDGYDEHSQTAIETMFKSLQRLQATVYVVGIGGIAGISLKGEMLLRKIAAQMGGRAFFPIRESQLPDIHGLIATDAYSRYLITYTPSNQEKDGSYRTIRLAAADPTFTVRARDGYFAPQPPPIRPTIEFSAAGDGEALDALAVSDLIVAEDGVPQTLESFQEAVAPMSIVMALDGSGSMRAALETAKDAARTFVRALRPTDPLTFVRFSDRVVFEAELSLWRDPTLNAIDAMQAAGGTALWDALYESMGFLRRQPGRRAIVVMTDGRDENNPGTAPGSIHTLDEVLAALRDTGTTVYTIGLGANVDREGLDRVAAASGGAAYFPEDASQLGDYYRRVVEDLRRRYILTYTSTNSRRDGGWREVAITSPRTGLVIRSAGGYEAPGPARAGQEPQNR